MPNLVNASVLFDFAAIDNLADFVTAYPELATEQARDTFNAVVKPHLLNELHYMPPKVHYPFVWASEKQRKYVMAMLRETNNLPYKRTGGMVNAWKVDVIVNDGTVIMSASNKNKAVKYVTGKQQQPGHVASGWPQHKETLSFWAMAAKEEVTKALHTLVNGR